MYAIFEDGGKQYKAGPGDMVLIERRDLPEGQTEITFDKVLMVGGEQPRIGQPLVEGATVTAKLLDEFKTPKVHGVKFARRKGLYKRWGHRQTVMKVQIDSIHA